jgi:hypothetical protein
LPIIVRDEPLHSCYRKLATSGRKELGRRYRSIAINMRSGKRHQSGQGPLPEPLAVAAVVDQRGLDPDRGPGYEPTGLLLPPGYTRGQAPRRGPRLLRRLLHLAASLIRGNANGGSTYARTGLNRRRGQHLAAVEALATPNIHTGPKNATCGCL